MYVSICHCPGAAVGSLKTCTHVIPMPESHKLALVFVGICVHFLSWHAQPNLVLVSPTHHTFIHDNEDAIMRVLIMTLMLLLKHDRVSIQQKGSSEVYKMSQKKGMECDLLSRDTANPRRRER